MGMLETAEAHGYDRVARVWRSKREPIGSLRETEDTIELLYRNTPDAETGHKVAVLDAVTEEQLTYRELKLRLQSVAAGLSEMSIKQGDVVLLLSPNSVWFPVICFGIMSLGAIVTTVNPLNTTYEITNQVKDSGAIFIITTPSLYPKVEPLSLPTVLLGSEESALPRNTIPFSRLLAADPNCAPKVTRRQSDTAALLYSSGTTGVSKGVVVTHRNLTTVAQQVHLLSTHDDRERRHLVTLPMFHVYGLAVVALAQLQRAGTLIILPKFEQKLFLRTLEKYRVTDLPLVPPMVLLLAKGGDVEKYDLSSVLEVTSGAAPLGKDLMQSLHQRFPSWELRQGYGMTETGGIISIALWKPDLSHFGSVGELVSCMEGKIVHVQTGENLPPLEHGEICVRGPNNMQGYLNNEKATAATIDSSGWLHTGDLGFFDKGGQLWVVDRLKELIKYKGYQVAPAELEAVLLTHPDISDAAVVPLPDREAGEIPIAWVVRGRGSKLTDKQVMIFVSRQVAPFKRLRRVNFIDTIPKSTSGKILRRELSEKAKAKL